MLFVKEVLLKSKVFVKFFQQSAFSGATTLATSRSAPICQKRSWGVGFSWFYLRGFFKPWALLRYLLGNIFLIFSRVLEGKSKFLVSFGMGIVSVGIIVRYLVAFYGF